MDRPVEQRENGAAEVHDAQAAPHEGGTPPTDISDVLERVRRHRRHTLELLTVCAVTLIPWTVVMALTLPSGYEVHQWRLTWVGFDVLLAVAMASTALLGWRRNRAVVLTALATSVLLICDAWFDVSLAFGTSDVWWSVALALLVELPLAFYLIRRVMGMISLAQWPSAEIATTDDA
ncbi:hypothetical protein ABTY96_22750 [Streptomyces sp. NPDC096057]|uniref:hypothetical protein n=1 Tax=Streptomyces sp. NPDC096057 TaxID=3155543 RepID=UPI00332B223F